LTVLVVEDDPINRLVCVRYLELLGHRALVAEHGAAAMALLQHHTGALDAVLTDISLPGKSGLEVAQDIRALEGGRWAGVPVMVMSAQVSEQSQAARLALGLASFLSKPFTLDELAATLGEVTRTGREPSTSQNIAPQGWLDEAFLRTEIETLGLPLLTELLTMFRTSLADTFSQMELALQTRAWREAGKLAHRLRSASANLGLTEVMTQARALELATAGDMPAGTQLAGQLAKLKETASTSCLALQQHLQAAPG
jgi:two-component system sensor histidine kinase TorS